MAEERLNETGVLVGFGKLKHNVSEIMTRLDHNFLNELDYFDDSNLPSSEDIAHYIENFLQTMIKKIQKSELPVLQPWNQRIPVRHI